MQRNSQLDVINDVASRHSFAADFNGRFSKYRFWKLQEFYGKIYGRIFEVGAGEGAFSSYLRPLSERLTLLEPAAVYFKTLKEHYGADEKVHLFHGLLEDFTYKDSYDLVVSCGVLEHVLQPQDFLRQIQSYISPGGALFLTVPNAEAFHRKLGLHMGVIREIHELTEQDHRVGHFRYYNFDTLRGEIEAAGYKVVKMEGIMFKPLPNSIMNTLSEQLCDALYREGCNYHRDCAEIAVLAVKDIK